MTGKKITINGGDTAGFDKKKVECFNCHKLGHFARECRNPRGQDGRGRSYDQGSRNQETTRRTVKVEEASPKAMLAVDGAGFDWSFMAEEEVPTNMALMAFSDSEVHKDKTCSSTCLKSFETLKTQYDKLRVEYNKTEFDLANYKRALASVEEQLAFYKQNNKIVSENSSVETKKTSDAPIIEDWVSDCEEDEIVSKVYCLQSSPRAAVPISIARPVNTAAPKSLVNGAKNRTNVFQKRHSPTRRPFHQETTLKNKNLKNKFNTVKTNYVNTVKTKRVTSVVRKKGFNAVKPSACWVWRPKIKGIDHGDPQVALKDTGIFDSGCSRHMTRNKSFMTNYREYDGVFFAFAGSSKGGKISGKGTIRTGVSSIDKEVKNSGILRNFITGIENQLNHRVKIIRSDNGTEFKNQDLNLFCNSKRIKREYSNARTPQQNGVAERKNRTLIEAARTIIAGNGLKWLFDIDSLTNTMNYHPVSARNRANVNACIETRSDTEQAEKEKVPDQEYILLPLLHTSSYGPSTSEEAVSSPHDDMATKHPDDARSQFKEECDAPLCKGMRTRTRSTNNFNTVRTPLNTANINDYPDDPLMPELEDTAKIHSIGIFGNAYDDSPNIPIDDQSVGAEADFNNMEPSINVSPIPTTRIHSIHPKDQIIGDPKSAVQIRIMAKKMEPKKVNQALDDVSLSWWKPMQESFLQFKLLQCLDSRRLPKERRPLVLNGSSGIRKIREGLWIKAIRLFLAYASYMDYTVYQMDVKSAFIYGTIEEEVYVNQPPGFEDPEFPNKVYKSIIQQKVKEKQEEKNIAEKAADHRTHTLEFLDSFKLTYKKSTIPLNNTPHSPDFSDFPPQPQYETYSCELCGNDAHFGYDLTQQHEQVVQKEQEEQAAFTPYWKIPIINDDDDEYTIQYREYLENSSNAITPDLPTKEPDNSLSMGDEHLSTIPETESDEVIKSSVEDLVLIPSESEGISDDTCDVPFCDNSPPLDVLNDHFEIFSDFNDDCTLSDDDYGEDIDYVEASPPDYKLVSLEEVKDDILHEKLLNINLLIAKIESLNDNPTPDCVLKSPSPFPIPVEDSDSFFEKSDTSLSYSDNSLPEFETFSDHTEETSSGSTTTHADNSLPEYDSFLFEIEPDQGELTK
ncbi:putative ribonuclease H-like domain-containing protein [Tanacetum coccineum]